MSEPAVDVTEKGDSKKAQKKEAKKAEKAAKRAEHRGNTDNAQEIVNEGKPKY